ncbi:MAG: hypothetical protein GEV10_07275 [Streptosporangiales bacterium]|nr:hypothetical protein [Streptosporangiales bacterium]
MLTGALDTQVRTHVATCADCQGVVDQLTSVKMMLSSLPAPPLPADVSARIDASLAQAQHERASLARDRQPTARPAGRRSWIASLLVRPQLLAGAAALIVALAFVGGYFSTRGGDGDTPDAAQSTNQAFPPADGPMMTGRLYKKADLAIQARELVKDSRTEGYTPDPEASRQIDQEVRRLSDPQAFSSCVDAITHSQPSRIVAADLGEFDGKPAAIVVMAIPDKPDSYEIAAVGAGCRTGDARILYSKVVPK